MLLRFFCAGVDRHCKRGFIAVIFTDIYSFVVFIRLNSLSLWIDDFCLPISTDDKLTSTFVNKDIKCIFYFKYSFYILSVNFPMSSYYLFLCLKIMRKRMQKQGRNYH